MRRTRRQLKRLFSVMLSVLACVAPWVSAVGAEWPAGERLH